MVNPATKAKLAAAAMGAATLAMPATAAFAAPATFTISTKADDTHTYDVYQIFTGDIANDNANKLSNIKAGSNAKGLDTEEKIDAAVEDIVATAADASTDSEKLSAIEKYVDLTGTPAATVTKDSSATVESGYYLIKDKDASVSDYDAYTLYIVKVAGNTTIERKSAVPEVDKVIVDAEGNELGHDDLSIGDTVSYKLTGTLPANIDEYSTYKYQFNDTLSSGLTRCAASGVKVTVDGTDVTSKFTVSDVNSDGLFTVGCDDLKAAGVTLTANSKVVVTYTATLNENATTTQAGNDNKVTLTFSNNPNTGGEGSTTTTPDTPDSTVEVHTYQLLISKTDKDGNALAGAGFTLYKKGTDGQYAAVGSEVTGTGDGANQFNWKGLGEGSYKLVETTTPSGYNTIKDVTFDVTPTYNGDELTGLAATNVQDADGALGDASFSGDVANGRLTAGVVNISGTILPTTGATGLIVLAGGAVLVLGCAGVVRMRQSADAE